MAKAEIETGTGTKIIVEGSVDEIAAIISLYNKNNPHVGTKEKNKNNQSKSSLSLVGCVLELRDIGFFDTPKKIVLVKERLDQDSHFYPIRSISTCLIRRNKNKELGRLREGKEWAYVKR